MKPGDPIKFNHPHGSVGRIDEANHYGGFYVTWHYGKDKFGDPITATASVRADYIIPITEEELSAVADHRAFPGDREKNPI